MPAVNWNVFVGLPGAATTNFEVLCRSLVRRHYARFGDFRALANQPGVEFHLRLHSSCELGEPGRWYGWQCRWYELDKGRAIGNARRRKIEKAIRQTEKTLPGVTDWVLWTRHPLTRGDSTWLESLETPLRLHFWNSLEIEDHLHGPAELLRSSYFGQLVLLPGALSDLHSRAVAAIKNRWHPEVHQVIDAERILRRVLGEPSGWSVLRTLGERLEAYIEAVNAAMTALPTSLQGVMTAMITAANAAISSLATTETALTHLDAETLLLTLKDNHSAAPWAPLVRTLRSRRQPISLQASNLLADMHGAYEVRCNLQTKLNIRMMGIVADAGCGKTQLAAQLTAATDDRPAGILLFGRDLSAGQNLDDLARRVAINGELVQTFESLIAAVDAAGQRAGRRLPIIIDGLNEAEDPRDWKNALAAAQLVLEQYPYTVVICTLRSAFMEEALPDAIDRLEIPGFEYDLPAAIRRYFEHYKIDAADADLPLDLLNHPLTLRMFCDVTNPTRKRAMGIEAMPTSLSALFDRYLGQVAERVAQLASRSWRYYESDVRSALNRIGSALWDERARGIDIDRLRKILADERRPWDQSLVRALEQDGVLIRTEGSGPGEQNVAVVYDALAGYLVADALLDRFPGADFESWIASKDAVSALSEDIDLRQPLASDVFKGLVGLYPSRRHRRQLWPLLSEPLRAKALREAALLEAEFLDSETVSELAALAPQKPSDRSDLFDRLRITRAARSHPLDAEFLESVLRPLALPDRDLRWSEWIRSRHENLLKDLQRLEHRWLTEATTNASDKLRARWVMWLLTSTVRPFRDQATRTLYRFGCRDPKGLFDLTLDSLSVNDPYVPERMLAACYGVSMSLWADQDGAELRAALPAFASALVDEMFVPQARCATRHILMRDSALGVIALARRIDPKRIPESHLTYISPPFDAIPSPFAEPGAIRKKHVADAKDAIQMDFGNYTIGHLVPDRGNYDFKHPIYVDVRRQIEARIVQLGYSSSRFEAIDRGISNDGWRVSRHGGRGSDRYGKKYSWIAYFEMYGLRQDQGKLPDWCNGERASDVDIDPSFPEPAQRWAPSLPDVFSAAPTDPRGWLAKGPTPGYGHLLKPESVDGERGPWALLEGFIEQSASSDDRRVFTFLRGVLVHTKDLSKLLSAFKSRDYPGNRAIPEPQEDYYTYAGEIPWSYRFGTNLRDKNGKSRPDRREAFRYHDRKRWRAGIPVEVPVRRFAWEHYHSTLNQVGGVLVPAPSLAEALDLVNHRGEWDLYDSSGNRATLCREFKEESDRFTSRLAYIRRDLLAAYMRKRRLTLVWLLWGEREFHYRVAGALREKVADIWSEHRHIHARAAYWPR